MEPTPIPEVAATLKSTLGTIFAILGLTLLVGCQGISVGSSSNQLVTGTLSFGAAALDFGSVAVGSSKPMAVTATNSGTSAVTISSAAISTKYFALIAPSLPATISPGQSTTLTVLFVPTVVGSFSATAAVSSNAANSAASISLTGTGIQSGSSSTGLLSLNSPSENFGSITLGTQQSQTVTLSNGGGASVTVTQASVSGAGFQLSGITTPFTLSPSQSASFNVTFSPSATGAVSGGLTIVSDAADPTLTMALSGTGTAPGTLGSNPTSLSFGNATIGSNQSLSETVTNTGGSSVTISQVGISGSGFSLSGITAPMTLSAGQSAPFTVAFAPTSSGDATGNVTITSNASNPTLTIPLSGTGLTPGALGSSPTNLSFGSVTVGNNQTLSETLTNTGGASVTISQVGISGSGFSLSSVATPLTLTAGQSTTLSVKFTPISATTSSGIVTVTSNASTPTLAVPLSGTGLAPGSLGSTPASLSFGSVTIGNNQSLSETVTNSGGTSVTISQATISGTGFSLSGISAPVTLTAGQSTTLAVTFAPTTAASATGAVTLTSNAPNSTLIIPLSGTGVAPGALGVNPTSLSFGSVTVGNNQSLSETVTNTGGASVTISQVASSGTGFGVSGITTPVILTAGQSATFTVTFTPASAATANGNITISSNASNSTLTVPLSGVGVAPGALGSNPTSLSFGSITVGNNQSLTETVTNTGGASVTISQASISGSGFSLSGITTPVTLTAGQSATFSVKFTPASAGSASGTVTIASNASNPTLTVALSGTGVAPGTLGSNPASLNFGTVTVGNNQSLSETVTNTGGASVTISQVATSGTGFSLSGITTPVTLMAGQGATFTIAFAPTSAGSASGAVTVTSNASNSTLSIALSGTGAAAVGQLTVAPTTMDLGSVIAGTSGTSSGSLTASGANVTVTGASSNNSVFSVGGLSLPVTIAAGQSVPFTITFSPQTVGAASGTLTVTSNAQPPTTTETLTGTGTAAPSHTVNLSWNASTSPNISGYNVYRAVYSSSCGSFSKINSVLNTTTLYADSSVVDGTSYCYATTAVNSSNEESGYSNIDSNVQIPAP
jgi:hypothetical protein